MQWIKEWIGVDPFWEYYSKEIIQSFGEGLGIKVWT